MYDAEQENTKKQKKEENLAIVAAVDWAFGKDPYFGFASVSKEKFPDRASGGRVILALRALGIPYDQIEEKDGTIYLHINTMPWPELMERLTEHRNDIKAGRAEQNYSAIRTAFAHRIETYGKSTLLQRF